MQQKPQPSPETPRLFGVHALPRCKRLNPEIHTTKKTNHRSKTMKSLFRKLSFCALLGASTSAYAAPVLIPNGDFSSQEPAAGFFSFFESVANVGLVSFPATGGSGDDGGYGLVNNTVGSWGGGLVAPKDFSFPSNQGIPLANLGLVAGNTYTFSMDMKNFAGTGTGGIKLEAWNGGAGPFDNTGNVPASGSSNEWATYSWDYSIPVGTTSIKIVPLVIAGNPPGGSGASTADSVGFDNIKVNNTPVPPPPFVPLQIPNGDFEIPAGANWSYYTDGFGLEYPTMGGNPGGNAVIDGTTGVGGYGVLVAFSNAEKTAASLGLTPGGPCTIQMDMKLISGTNVGGLKLEGPSGFGPVIEPAPLAGVGEWATYTFEFTLQNGENPVNQFKIVPLGRKDSIVAYDNVKIVLPAPPGPLQASIAQGTSVSWFAGSAVNQYQPQQSADNVVWTNLGPALIGDSVSSVFDSEPSPNYQVLESVPTVTETVFNGSFDEQGDFEDEADGWNFVQSQPAERLTTGGRNGLNDECIRILVLNSSTAPEGCEIQQNTKDADSLNPGAGAVIPGNTYDFSFYAKQVAKSGSYEQRFRISWLNDIGAVMGDGGFQNFPLPVTGNWVQLTQNGLVAPAGATTALIQILGVTGAEAPGDTGEVLIDDVTLLSTGFGSPNVLVATATPAVEISWPSTTGQDYQVQSSPNLDDWADFGGVISGDNTTKAVYDAITPPAKFYKVGELP
jgi:hypothetical protein